MADYQNSAVVDVPSLYVDDVPMVIEIWQSGHDAENRAQFSYRVIEDRSAVLTGSDLFGPAYGMWPEAEEMAVTLASFLGATYDCGELTEHGRSYTADEREWLSLHSERFGMWASEMQEQRQNS